MALPTLITNEALFDLLWTNSDPGIEAAPGKLSDGKESAEKVSLGKCLLGKRTTGKLSSGKLSWNLCARQRNLWIGSIPSLKGRIEILSTIFRQLRQVYSPRMVPSLTENNNDAN